VELPPLSPTPRCCSHVKRTGGSPSSFYFGSWSTCALPSHNTTISDQPVLGTVRPTDWHSDTDNVSPGLYDIEPGVSTLSSQGKGGNNNNNKNNLPSLQKQRHDGGLALSLFSSSNRGSVPILHSSSSRTQSVPSQARTRPRVQTNLGLLGGNPGFALQAAYRPAYLGPYFVQYVL
jgi:hypothetical protein